MQTIAQDRLMLKMDLSDALAADQLYLVYQPTLTCAPSARPDLRRCCAGATPSAA
jgi:hypothetical protein